MARTPPWRDLVGGIIAALVLVSIVVGTLLFARVGSMRGDKSILYVLTDEATGVLPGTEVWLAGQKVGLVKRISYRPAQTDTSQRLAIRMEIMADKLPYIRRNSRADIRAGGNLIGAPVVFISPGSSAAPPVDPGDSILTVPAGPIRPVFSRVTSLTPKMDTLAKATARLMAMMNSPSGAIGAFQERGIPRLARLNATLAAMNRQATTGDGTIGLAMRGDLGARMTSITARKDSLTALLSSGSGSIGRFQKDSTLMKSVTELKAELDSLKTLFGSGTFAKMKTDTALAAQMARMQVELTALMADVKKKPGRYIAF